VLPARDELDLVEESVHRLVATQLRLTAVVLLEQERELICGQLGEPVVVEAHEDRALRRQALPPRGLQLAQEGGLSPRACR
jgi:hypothetical protein